MSKKVWGALLTMVTSGMVLCAAGDLSLNYAGSQSKQDNLMLAGKTSLASDTQLLAQARSYAHKDERRKRKSLWKEVWRKRRAEKRNLRSMWDYSHKKVSDESRQRWREMKERKAEARQANREWRKKHRQMEVARDYQDGAYADLYLQPEWGHAGTFATYSNFVNVGMSYHYATDAYDSKGTNRDVATLAFSERPIALKDILLVSKLLTERQGFGYLNDDAYLSSLANNKIILQGECENWNINLSLMRHVWKDKFVLGATLPFVYKKHRLHAALDKTTSELISEGVPLGVNYIWRYGEEALPFIKDIAKAKGMDELGGSTAGLGDVQVFIHSELHSPHFDRALFGVNFNVPTAPKTPTHRLWGPQLGNGGHFEGSLFFAISNTYKWYINPHIRAEVSGSLPAHVELRVPRRVQHAVTVPAIAGLAPANTTSFELFGKEITAFGDRVGGLTSNGAGGAFPPTVRSFDEFDTDVRGFADKPSKFRLRKGEQFNLRIGNMVEKFIFRRSFLDLYYNFRAKLRDYTWGVPESEVRHSVYRENTHQLEHKIGAVFSYQTDDASRVRLHTNYAFAGHNVEKGVDVSLSLDYSF